MDGRFETAADFLAAAALAVRDVPLPDGRSIRVRELSVLARAEFSRTVAEDRSKAGAWVVAQSCLDSRGLRLFSDEQVGELMISSPRFVEFLAGEILKFSGLVKDGAPGNA